MSTFPTRYIKLVRRQNVTFVEEEGGTIQLGENEDAVVIKTHYSSINYRDYLAFNGNAGVARRFPYVPGVDVVGEIVKSNSVDLLCGDRVAALAVPHGQLVPGGWASYCKLPSKKLFKLPADWDTKDVVTVGTAGLAAASGVAGILSMPSYEYQNDLDFLVTGATGGVGIISCLLALELGWNVVAVTRQPGVTESMLRELGIQRVIDSETFISAPKMNLLPARYDAAIDTVGGIYLTTALKQIKENGICASAGMIAGQDIVGLTVLPFLMRGITLIGTGAEVLRGEREHDARRLVAKLMGNNSLKNFSTEIRLGDVGNWLSNWANRTSVGRIIIRFD